MSCHVKYKLSQEWRNVTAEQLEITRSVVHSSSTVIQHRTNHVQNIHLRLIQNTPSTTSSNCLILHSISRRNFESTARKASSSLPIGQRRSNNLPTLLNFIACTSIMDFLPLPKLPQAPTVVSGVNEHTREFSFCLPVLPNLPLARSSTNQLSLFGLPHIRLLPLLPSSSLPSPTSSHHRYLILPFKTS